MPLSRHLTILLFWNMGYDKISCKYVLIWGVAISAKAFMRIPAQQAAKFTRPLMPSAAPAVLLHSLHTQQGICNMVTQ